MTAVYMSGCNLYLGVGMETCIGGKHSNLNSLYTGRNGLLKSHPLIIISGTVDQMTMCNVPQLYEQLLT